MNGFENYKNTNYKKENVIMKAYNFFSKYFNFKVRRIILTSVLAFAGGSAVTFGAFYALNKFSPKQDGVGGLETSAVPDFTDLENLSDEVQGLSSSGLEITGEDSLDIASQVFDEDEKSSNETLELSYDTYKVKQGDMVGFIAENFGITQDALISVNDIRQSRNLQIGTILKIPSISGIVYTIKKSSETIQSIADKYEVSAEKCARVNGLPLDSRLTPGKPLFIPDAKLDWVTIQETNGDLFHRPIKSRYYLSSQFGWRSSPFTGKRSYHSGVDMACPTGTKIYAALAGTVTTVGYNSVYGNYVIVTHHSGYKTLYGHMSQTSVIKGKYVDTNTVIGRVGSTGLSTGPHLHFTVFKFGKTVNPQVLWR